MQRRFIFEGPTTLKDFMDWLLETDADALGNLTFKNQDAIVIAHNFKGYDGQFILNYLVHTACIKPSVNLKGSKSLCLEVCESINFKPQTSKHKLQPPALCPGQAARRLWII
jgi:hypothetical protein